MTSNRDIVLATGMMLRDESSALHSVKVLLVEDDPLVRWTARRFLEKMSCHVTDVETCLDAERLWRAGGIDIVVSDYRLLDGISLDMIAKMRADGHNDPVVCMTAESESISESIKQRLKICDVLSKPLNADALSSAMRRALDGKLADLEPTREAEHRVGRFVVVKCSGNMDVDALHVIMKPYECDIWLALEMTDVLAVDDSTIAMLMEFAGNMRLHGGRLCLVGLRGSLLGSLMVNKLDRQIDVLSDVRELAALGRKLSSVCERMSVLDCVVRRD